jgi:hypothetical protein
LHLVSYSLSASVKSKNFGQSGFAVDTEAVVAAEYIISCFGCDRFPGFLWVNGMNESFARH